MKSKLFILSLIGLIATGISVSQAEDSVYSSLDDHSSQNNLTNFSVPFLIQPQPAIPVNESEIRAGLLYDAVSEKIVWQKNRAAKRNQ